MLSRTSGASAAEYEELKAQLQWAQGEERARINERLGAIHRSAGEVVEAIEQWQAAVAQYESLDQQGKAAQGQVVIAALYTHQGQPGLAIPLLQKALTVAQSRSNQELEREALAELGNAYLSEGNYSKAITVYQSSLALKESLALYNNLVFALSAQQQKYQEELKIIQAEKHNNVKLVNQVQAESNLLLEYASRALELSQGQNDSSAIYVLLNWAQVSPGGLTVDQLERGRAILKALPTTRTKVYLLVDWAQIDPQFTQPLLLNAVEEAKAINDLRAASFALLELGDYFEQRSSPRTALLYAQEAEKYAQAEFAYDSLYRAQWQAGRVYASLGQLEAALVAYRGAIASLQTVQTDLVAASRELRLNFQEEVEPVYRQYLGLLLEQPSTTTNLKEALSIFDTLQLAQLQNFFGDDCFELVGEEQSPQKLLAQTDAALITSVILPDKNLLNCPISHWNN